MLRAQKDAAAATRELLKADGTRMRKAAQASAQKGTSSASAWKEPVAQIGAGPGAICRRAEEFAARAKRHGWIWRSYLTSLLHRQNLLLQRQLVRRLFTKPHGSSMDALSSFRFWIMVIIL